MRYRLVLAVAAGFLAAGGPVFAQYPAEAVVLQDVEVRSGPSKTFVPTSKLLRGDKVIVIRECKESAGWLEIKPPVHSFSWINGKFAKQIDARYAYVDADPARPAPVLPGSTLVNQEPNREIIKLIQGTIVIIVDRPQGIGGDTWLPIMPHPSEVRYIPVEAVKAATQIATTNAVPNWTLTPNGYYTTNAMLADAETARKNGDYNRARQLYSQVANTTTDQSQKVYAMGQLNSLPQGPFQTASAQKDPITAYSPAVNPQPVPVPSQPAAATSLITTQAPAWSSPGRLRDTTLKTDDGQPIYVLEDPQGRALGYVSTPPQKSLQDYVGRMVAVYGPTVYRANSAVRLQYIVATHVAMP